MANKLEGFLVGAIQAAFEDLDVYCRASLKSSKETFHLSHRIKWNELNAGQIGLVVLEIGDAGTGYIVVPVRAFICLAGSMMLLPKERISEMMNQLEVDEECQLTIHEVGNLVAGTLGRFGREHHALEHSIRLKEVMLKPEAPLSPEDDMDFFAYEFALRTDRSETFEGFFLLPRALVESAFKGDQMLEDLKAQAELLAESTAAESGAGGHAQGWQGGAGQNWQGGPPPGWQGGPPPGWQGEPPPGWQGGPPPGWQGGPPSGWQGGPPPGWQGGPPPGWQGGPPQGWQGGPPQGWQGGPPQGWQGGPPPGWQGGPPPGWQGGPPPGWQGGGPPGWQGGAPPGWQPGYGGGHQGWQQAGWQSTPQNGFRTPGRGGDSGAVSAGRAALLTALSEPELPRSSAQVQLHGIQILIVDASWVARRTLAKLLIPHGCVVSDAKDSATARGLMTRRNFDLILLEVNLQGESGLDFCRALRAEGLTERMAVVMTSSGSTSDQVVQSIHAGASFFLVKPIGEQYLLRVLSGVLRQYRSGAPKVAAG